LSFAEIFVPIILLGGMNSSAKTKRPVLWWSTLIFFVTCWVIPIRPVNGEWEPMYSYFSGFFDRPTDRDLFDFAGLGVMVAFIAAPAFLVAVTLGWLVERAVLFVRSRGKRGDHDIAA
jgi:hypothetical protein